MCGFQKYTEIYFFGNSRTLEFFIPALVHVEAESEVCTTCDYNQVPRYGIQVS